MIGCGHEQEISHRQQERMERWIFQLAGNHNVKLKYD